MPRKKNSDAGDATEAALPTTPPAVPAARSAATAPPPASCSGAVKLPEFYKDDPSAWFGTLESIFVIKGVADPVLRFHYAVQRLDCETSTFVRTLLRAPPDASSYANLRKKLCAVFERLPESRLDEFLATSTSGDVKPSRFAESLLRLTDDLTIDDVRKRVFLRSLPPQFTNAVANTRSSSFMDVVVEAADLVYATVSEAARQHQPPAPLSVHAVVAQPRRPQPDRPRNPPQGKELCWYHRRFGEAARSCQPTCARFTQKQPPTQVFHVEEQGNG